MGNSYDDIQAYIQQANRLRSDALGALLAAGWEKLVGRVKRLMDSFAPAGEVAEDDVVVLGS